MMPVKHLCSAIIHCMLWEIPSKLQHHAFARVVFPDDADIAVMIEQCDPLVQNVIVFMD